MNGKLYEIVNYCLLSIIHSPHFKYTGQEKEKRREMNKLR